MKFVPITPQNLEFALTIQREIFPHEDARANYMEAINPEPSYIEKLYFIVYDNDNAVGLTGLYAITDYPDDAWLGWFGVRAEHRRKGYASKIMEHYFSLASEKGYKTARLYTDGVDNPEACIFYERMGMVGEQYAREDESDFINRATWVYSKPLDNTPLVPWNNRPLNLTEQVDLAGGEHW